MSVETESILNSHVFELYKSILSFTKNNTEAVGKNQKLSLSKAFDIASHIINDFKRSTELMDAATNFYDPLDLCISHAVNVAIFSLKVAIDMGLPREGIEDTLVAALLHDIGCGKLPESMRHKEADEVSGEDRKLVQMHTQYAYEAISPKNDRDKRIAETMMQHHEKADGSGYPNGLKESEQWPETRIVSIVDTYESLIHPRPYRDALKPPRGIETIIKQKGSIYSPHMVKALLSSLSLYPVGLFVRLNNGFVGKVVKTHKDSPARPDVRLYFDSSGQKLQIPKEVSLKEDHLLVVEECLPGLMKKVELFQK